MKRYLKVGLVFLLVFVLVSGSNVKASGQELAKKGPNLQRIAGNSRVETAIAVSRKAYREEVDTLFLAGYNGDADALAATFMAGKMDAPLLLANSKSLSKDLLDEIHRLSPEEIIILGGENVVSRDIEKELKEYNTKRIKGSSRIETAVNIANDYYKEAVLEEVFIVEYNSLVDALAIGPVAAKTGIPVLLTHRDRVPEKVGEFLKAHKVEEVTIVGGESTVSKKGMDGLSKYVGKVGRVSGKCRVGTSINIARNYFEGPHSVLLANGWKNADALIGGYFAGMQDGPILLAGENTLKNDAAEYIKDKMGDTYILGGQTVISNRVYDFLEGLIKTDAPFNPEEGSIENDIKIYKSKKEIENILNKKINGMKRKIEILVSSNFTSSDILKALNKIYHSGSYGAGSISNYGVSSMKDKYGTKIKVNMNYDNTREQEAYIDSKVKRIAASIIKPGMSDYKKVKAVHDYIVKNTVYTTGSKVSPHSSYALFKEGKGVCSAYALAASRLLDEIGIGNYYITGTASNRAGFKGLHAWNKVKVDGRWYNMDVTWDDPVTSDGSNIVTYDYFLISDKKMNRDHRADKMSKTPAATRNYR